MKTQISLLELSNILVARGFSDIFDSQVEGECLNVEEMTGSWADPDGEEIIEFTIIELSPETDHLETIVEIETTSLV